MKTTITTTLKVLFTGILIFVGTLLGGMAASAAGLPAPAMPEGSDPNTLVAYLLLASLGIGALLTFLAARLAGSLLRRWLVLAGFTWGLYSLGTYLEASIFTTFASASFYKVIMDLVAFLLSAGSAVLLFGPSQTSIPAWSGSYSFQGWVSRMAAAWVAFPLIYLGFGKLVEPFVIQVYRDGLFEMTAPGWEQIIPMQMLRSLLFLITCLALLPGWNRGRGELWAALSAALFLLVDGFYMLQAYWLPAGFRLVHSLEMLSDALVYSAVIVGLFASPRSQRRPITARQQLSGE